MRGAQSARPDSPGSGAGAAVQDAARHVLFGSSEPQTRPWGVPRLGSAARGKAAGGWPHMPLPLTLLHEDAARGIATVREMRRWACQP